jgi:prolipoprotein diacylglyceryl transferase
MQNLPSLAWLHWDPPKEAFTLPILDIPVMWYGIIFAFGFVLGYFILIPILQKTLMNDKTHYTRDDCVSFADRVTWFIVAGTIIGARLGHVLFYDWPYYSAHPMEILMIRKGGLASHGGTVGVIIALLFFIHWHRKRFPEASLIMLMDVLVIPTAMAVTFIRIANFFNQEILGYQTTMPWGVIFGHPSDGSNSVPRHPAQLYEALAYFATFCILYAMWKKWGTSLKQGILSGTFFVLVFGSRFFIEYFKTEQPSWIDQSTLQTGQLLSIPFVLLGIALIILPKKTIAQITDCSPKSCN